MIRAELRKLTTIRSVTGLAVAVVAFAFLALAPAWTLDESAKADWTAVDLLRGLRGPASVVGLAALVVGVLATAGEVRHGTLASTLVVAPRRGRVAMAKLAVVAGFATALALALGIVTVALGTVMLRSADVDVSPFSGDVLATVAAVVAVAVAYGAVGVGLGLLGRDQTAVLVGAVVWATVVENMVPVILRAPELDRWTVTGAARSVVHVATPDPALAGPAVGLLVLALVASALMAGGAAVFARRDVQ